MYRLTLGVKINGENGPQLIVKGETKEEAVASLRSFVNETQGGKLALSFQYNGGRDSAPDTVTLTPDGSVVWHIAPLNRLLATECKKKKVIETWPYTFQAVNEFCQLAYRMGPWN